MSRVIDHASEPHPDDRAQRVWHFRLESWKYDEDNSEFWNYLCGTNSALGYGLDVTTRRGIEDFNTSYFEYYPYLKKYLDFALLESESILVIGLGLGTVSRYLASNVESYLGLDVAPNVISFLREDFKNRHFNGEFVLGSIIADVKELEGRKFDAVVSIGSLHHTGRLEYAIDNALKFLNPGGQALIMIYNKFSLFNITHSPKNCLSGYFDHLINGTSSWKEMSEEIRAINDSDDSGKGAPSTEYSHQKIFADQNVIWKTQIRNMNHLRLPVDI